MDAPGRTGHFTTFQVRDGAVRGLDLHVARLDDATHAMFGCGLDLADLRARLRQAIAGEARRGCTVRVVVARGDGANDREGMDNGHAGAPAPRIEVEAPREPGSKPLRLQSRRVLRTDPQFKHLGIAPQLEARRQALAAGFDDALLVGDDGLVAEGSFWNIGFADRTGVTWPLAPALRGVTERLLQARLAEAGVAQQVRPIRVDALAAYDFAFAANSRGVQEVGSIDGHAFRGDPEFAAMLHAAFEDCPWQIV